jgi:FMN-dependent oxidoreductase (nitrilotriacetate monooxygenase family)
MVPDLVVDMARALERACFDYVLIEDSSYVGESYGGRQLYLESALSVPRQDPSVVATLMAAATQRIGIVPTLSTFAYPPYLLARLVASLDQVSSGRIGWNMVTGSSDYAAMNYGMPGMPEHDLRYDMADEYMDAVNALWDSWEPGAILADTERGIMVDHTKVKQADFEGKWFKTRGPLNSGPCVQGRPVIAQAGGSMRGKRFAALHADTIVASVKGIDGMRAYRDDVRKFAVAQGRNPDHIKVLFMVSPIVGETMEEAQLRLKQRLARSEAHVPQLLAHFGKTTNIDFSQYDLDTPVDQLDLRTNGHQQNLDDFKRIAGKRSIRQAMLAYRGNPGSMDLVGTPDAVASQMAEAMEQAGGDGFLIMLNDVSRRTIAEIADGLVPALQARGLARRAYGHAQFRDNLREF